MIEDQLKQARQKYYSTLNRLNLLLLRQHTYNRQKSLYQSQLIQINNLIEKIQNNKRESLPLNIVAQDNYLRSLIKSNNQEIINLQRKLQGKGKQMIQQMDNLKSMRQKYLKMISSDFQSSIQQKLSMIRGKVDDLKKKIKQINKEILAYQQQHLQDMDQNSMLMKSLQSYKIKNQLLRQEIKNLKEAKNK